MFTNRITKSTARSLLAAGTLGIAAIVGADAANADAVDDAYIASLAEAGIPQIKPALAISAGHAVCHSLDEGATPDELVAAFVARKVFATKQQDVAMITVAIAAYCPQYQPLLNP